MELNEILVGGSSSTVQVDVKGSIIVTLNDEQVQMIVNQILEALRAKGN